MSDLTCELCNERPGDQMYADDGTAAAHGWIKHICGPCMWQKQLVHAQASAERIPDLEAKLAEATQ